MSLIIFLKEWVTEIIAAIVGAILLWFMDFLPAKYQVHKRLTYSLKVKKAISNIELSINVKEQTKIEKIKEIMNPILDRDGADGVKLQRDIRFNSLESGASYVISTKINFETEENFILISCFNGFNIGFLGNIKNLNTTINELLEMSGCFNNLKENKEKVTIHISITPRERVLFSKEISNQIFNKEVSVSHVGKNFSTSYNTTDIKLVNEGLEYLEENVNKVFYEWMTCLI